jgi:hypothetical protein
MKFSGDGLLVILCIVADGSGVCKRMLHGVMEPVDHGLLLGCDVDEIHVMT